MKLALLAYLMILWVSFTGALTAGLGQGFDLGTEWPGALYRLISAVASGSFEPVHRFSTVATGIIVAIAAAVYFKKYRLFAAGVIASLVATAITGRIVLLALGGKIPAPWSYAIYPVNNFLAFLTAFFALMIAMPHVQGWKTRVLLRGAAFWSIVSSLSGAYMLGLHKIERAPFDPNSPLFYFHLAAGALAVVITLLAARGGHGLFRTALVSLAVAQAVTAIFMYYGVLANTWAPGFQTALHTVFAHGLATLNLALYLKSR